MAHHLSLLNKAHHGHLIGFPIFFPFSFLSFFFVSLNGSVAEWPPCCCSAGNLIQLANSWLTRSNDSTDEVHWRGTHTHPRSPSVRMECQ